MKKITAILVTKLFVVLMLIPTLAHAEWKQIGGSTNVHTGRNVLYIDTKSFIVKPGAGSVSLLLEHDAPQPYGSQAYRSAQMRLYVNCDSHMYRLENSTLYPESMGVGKVIAILPHDALSPFDDDKSAVGLLAAGICNKISQLIKP